MRNRKHKTLSVTIDYWFFIFLIMVTVFIFLNIMLIKERLFVRNLQSSLERYKTTLASLYELNSQISIDHPLSQNFNFSFFSSSDLIYFPENNLSYRGLSDNAFYKISY